MPPVTTNKRFVIIALMLCSTFFLNAKRSHSFNSSYLPILEDTTQDSVQKKIIDSLEGQLYVYYNQLFDCQQKEATIKNMLAEIASMQEDIKADSIKMMLQYRKILSDTTYNSIDSNAWISIVKQFISLPEKKDSLLVIQRDSIVHTAIQTCKKKNGSKTDSTQILKELESFRKGYKTTLQKKVEWERLNKEIIDLMSSTSNCDSLENTINRNIQNDITPVFTNLLSKDSGFIISKVYKNKKYLLFKLVSDPKQDSLEISILPNNTKNGRTIKAGWDQCLAKKQQPIMIMNAGMFNESYSAQGLLIENGKTINFLDTDTSKGKSGNFYLQPNGVFFIKENGKCYLKTTKEFIKEENTSKRKDSSSMKKIKYATQSGPMLVINNKIHPAFNPSSKNVNIRNGIGIRNTNKNQEIFLVISDEQVTFHEFASFFKDKLQCDNALYLDGVVSRTYMQIGKQQKGKLDNSMGLGPLFLIYQKKN